MGRQHRIDPENGIHHVYTRGSKRWTIFHDDLDRQRFLGLLSKACDAHQVSVLAFCLMNNHVHLVVQCPQAGLSDFMRDVKSAYARWFNQRHRSSGPIFENRFGSKLVLNYRQLRTVVRYVHRNPYAMNPSMDLASYAWSSHRMYLGMQARPVWLDCETAAALFDNYQLAIERPVASDEVQNLWTTASASEEVPGTSSLEPTSWAIADIVVAVAHSAAVQVADVHPRRRNGLVGVAAVLALDDAGLLPREAAEPLGYRTSKALLSAAARSRIRLQSDERAMTILAQARLHLLRTAA